MVPPGTSPVPGTYYAVHNFPFLFSKQKKTLPFISSTKKSHAHTTRRKTTTTTSRSNSNDNPTVCSYYYSSYCMSLLYINTWNTPGIVFFASPGWGFPTTMSDGLYATRAGAKRPWSKAREGTTYYGWINRKSSSAYPTCAVTSHYLNQAQRANVL